MSTVPPSIDLKPQAMVCKERTILKGNISIGNRTFVHPTVEIIAENGPIVIGESNIIEENTVILNRSSEAMVIGNSNVFEVGTHCESIKVGDNNIFEYNCNVGPKCIVSNGCVIGAKCQIRTDETLPENTVIFGGDCQRRTQIEKPTPQTLQLDFLIKVMPNYQRFLKPYKATS